MYYDDEARRFNFISGFVLGTALGAGLTLLIGAGSVKKDARRLRTAARRARRRYEPIARRLGRELREPMSEWRRSRRQATEEIAD